MIGEAGVAEQKTGEAHEVCGEGQLGKRRRQSQKARRERGTCLVVEPIVPPTDVAWHTGEGPAEALTNNARRGPAGSIAKQRVFGEIAVDLGPPRCDGGVVEPSGVPPNPPSNDACRPIVE